MTDPHIVWCFYIFRKSPLHRVMHVSFFLFYNIIFISYLLRNDLNKVYVVQAESNTKLTKILLILTHHILVLNTISFLQD